MPTKTLTHQALVTNPRLAALRASAVALMPARHTSGDVAWVEVTETLRYSGSARRLGPEALAALCTAALDHSAAEWAEARRVLNTWGRP